jgi:Protein kinase domain
MSPEQCSQAAEIDSRSDIYSFGVILYEMLVGHVPFTGESPTAIMMKHLQEPPPSVLEERKDLPAAVARVVARALAKRPEDRFQTVSELSDGLTAAAEEPVAAVATDSSPESANRKTNRIVVPTGPNEAPRDTTSEDHDEATVVRARPEPLAVAADEPEIFSDVIEEARESFNPWRVVIPAIAGLLVIFAVVYALTRNSSSNPAANDNSQPLTVDPNGQPVQPSETPTGAGEQGIRPNASPTTPGGNASVPETNPNANTGTDLPAGNTNERPNDTKPNENTGEPQPSPSPSKTPSQLPSPRLTPTPDTPPDEPPKMPTPKPTPPAGNPGGQTTGAGSSPGLP